MMPIFSASAPGKAILLGEHAVVYGFPAIAVPVNQVQARVTIEPAIHTEGKSFIIHSPAIHMNSNLYELPDDHPFQVLVSLVRNELGIHHIPNLTLRINSSIPPAAGLGSGAAVSVAFIRALTAFLGGELEPATVCQMAYTIEKLYHGTPSGIDNTVITYNTPIYFRRNHAMEHLHVHHSLNLVIADTGIKSSTRETVGDVRLRYQQDPEKYQILFEQVGNIVEEARLMLTTGNDEALGNQMDQNHALLQEIGVSSLELDQLVQAARSAGALGAKLSGGGLGGNIIALARPGEQEDLRQALITAGARNAFLSNISPVEGE